MSPRKHSASINPLYHEHLVKINKPFLNMLLTLTDDTDLQQVLIDLADGPWVNNDYGGLRPIHIACRTKSPIRLTIAKLLIELDVDIDNEHTLINERDKDDWTPLHYACDHMDEDLIKVLIEAGADVNAKTKGAVTPLLLVAHKHPNIKLTKILLAAGADPNVTDYEGYTVLHYVCGDWYEKHNISDPHQSELLDYEIIKALIEHGADLDLSDNNQGGGGPALYHALTNCQPSYMIIKLLIDRGACYGPYWSFSEIVHEVLRHINPDHYIELFNLLVDTVPGNSPLMHEPCDLYGSQYVSLTEAIPVSLTEAMPVSLTEAMPLYVSQSHNTTENRGTLGLVFYNKRVTDEQRALTALVMPHIRMASIRIRTKPLSLTRSIMLLKASHHLGPTDQLACDYAGGQQATEAVQSFQLYHLRKFVINTAFAQ